LKEIGVVDLERLKHRMGKGDMKPRTIEYALAVVRQVFNYARRTGYYDGDSPTKLVKKPKVNNARLRYLEPDEAERLFEELESFPVVRDMALVSLHCGLRFGEIASLPWDRVDMPKGLLILLDTKHGDRQVPMTAQVRVAIEKYRTPGCAGLVFPRPIRGGVRSDIGKCFRDAVERVGLNDGVVDDRLKVVFHSLRHTFASWHVLVGTDLYTLGKLMGHKTPTMTARYGHLSPEGAVRAMRAFEGVLEKQAQRGKVVTP
jgi:integrase